MIDQKKRNMAPAPVVIKTVLSDLKPGKKVVVPSLSASVLEIVEIYERGNDTIVKLQAYNADGTVTIYEAIQGVHEISLFIDKLTASQVWKVISKWVMSWFKKSK